VPADAEAGPHGGKLGGVRRQPEGGGVAPAEPHLSRGQKPGTEGPKSARRGAWGARALGLTTTGVSPRRRATRPCGSA
jgi:hypothetical protein